MLLDNTKKVKDKEERFVSFSFKANEPSIFNNRIRSSIKFNLLITLGIFVFIAFLSNWRNGLLISALVFFIQFYKSWNREKYFITSIEIDNNEVFIKYKDKGQEKEISGNKKDFRFKEKITFNRTRTVYLAIYFRNNLIIKQFEIGEWDENIFDKIIAL